MPMKPEEFEKLKEQHKAHLREINRLKGLARDAGRQGRLAQALGDIAGALDSDTTYDEVMDTLNRETAQSEARFEIAQENQAAQSADALEKAAQELVDEEALSRDRARTLVEQMKAQMGGPSPTAPPAAAGDAPKTLGRTPAAGTLADASSDAPAQPADKTLGRRS